jgi:hypothetical protein
MFEIMNTLTGPLELACVGFVLVLVIMSIMGVIEALLKGKDE